MSPEMLKVMLEVGASGEHIGWSSAVMKNLLHEALQYIEELESMLDNTAPE
jgi:hypothetical protein